MRPVLALAPLALCLLAHPVRAEEGMWRPGQLPDAVPGLADELGFDPAGLSDLSVAPLAAMVSLGFCSASLVSPDGLVLTNHHCVLGYLQYLSDEEQNYARDGFLAGSREEELHVGPGARIRRLVEERDVTQEVERALPRRLADLERRAALDRVVGEMVAACEEENPGSECRVVSDFGGLSRRLVRYERYPDVRLVYAPPDSVGNYGDEIDNWTWPRHSGDFALLRIWTGPDGAPADHAEENVPLSSPAFLPVSTEGLAVGDRVLQLGWPGRTSRYQTAPEVRYTLASAERRIARTTQVIDILRAFADSDPAGAPKLNAPIQSLGNSRKFWQGAQEGLSQPGMLQRLERRDAELAAWIEADRRRQRRYGPALEELTEELARHLDEAEAREASGQLTRMSDLLWVAARGWRLALEREKAPEDRAPGYQPRDEQRIRDGFARLERRLYLPAERPLLELAFTWLPGDDPVSAWLEQRGGAEAALDQLFSGDPAPADAAWREALLERDRASLEADEDPWLSFARALETWQAPDRAAGRAHSGAMVRLRPVVLEALSLHAEEQGRTLYPDANGTLRISTGRVMDYQPRDAVRYAPFTRLSGVVEKAGPVPYAAPPALLARAAELAAEGATPSRWTDPTLGEVPVNFLADLDLTGGSSGSPVIDAQGRLVGTAFDVNYQSIHSDWLFDSRHTRSIQADIRYMLWMLDEVEERGGWLVEELIGTTESN